MYKHARKLADQGKEEESLKVLELLHKRYPEFKDAYISDISIAFDMEDPKLEEYIGNAKFALQDDDSAKPIFDAFDLMRLGENQKAYDILKASDSSNPDLLGVVSETALDMGLDKDAEVFAAKCLKLAPLNAGCQYDELMLDVARNEFEMTSRDCVQIGPNSWAGIPCALADLGRDKPEATRKRFHALANIVINSGRYRRLTARSWEIDTLVYEGKFTDAVREAEMVTEESFGEQFADERRYDLARLAYFQGNIPRAAELASNLLKVADDPDVVRDTMVLLARIGIGPKPDFKTTDSSAAELINSFQDDRAGSVDKVVADLERAYEADQLNSEVRFELAVAYINSKQTDRAIALLQALIKDKGRAIIDSDAYYWVVAHYQLGKCLESTNNKEAAIRSYSDFLSLWRNADKNLKLVADAKKSLAQLNRK